MELSLWQVLTDWLNGKDWFLPDSRHQESKSVLASEQENDDKNLERSRWGKTEAKPQREDSEDFIHIFLSSFI